MREVRKQASPITVVLVLFILYLVYDIFIGVNKIAVVVVNGGIDREKASNVITALDIVEKDPFVRAVVLNFTGILSSATSLAASLEV